MIERSPFAVVGVILISLCAAACSPSYPHRATASTAVRESPAINIQEGAPYPADMDHLDQILSIGSGHALPEGAEVISVKPSTNFAARYPGGWGYVIAFTATDSAIQNYVTTYTNR